MHKYEKMKKNEKYKKQIVSETVEKIKLRPYGSVYFRNKTLFQGEEFLYYPLPYELFAMCIKMIEVLKNNLEINFFQLYYGIMYNGISALSLMEDNLLGSAYPLCRGAIEIYFKFLILNVRTDSYKWYEKFRDFEVEQSCCSRIYPEEFNRLFAQRVCQDSKSKVEYLHFGWVDFIAGYHKVVRKSPYSVYGIITFLKNEVGSAFELEHLENFYKSCHAYIHGSVQAAKYPELHYFEISIMLYYIIRSTFQLLCQEKREEITINGMDIILMIDRDFKVLYEQYKIRSTENFEGEKSK